VRSRASLPFSTSSVIGSSIECITSCARSSTSDRNHSASKRSMYGNPKYATTQDANATGSTKRNMMERNIALKIPKFAHAVSNFHGVFRVNITHAAPANPSTCRGDVVG